MLKLMINSFAWLLNFCLSDVSWKPKVNQDDFATMIITFFKNMNRIN